MRGPSKKANEETGLKSLQLGCCYRKLSCFYKFFNSKHPHYLFKLIPSRRSGYVTRSIHNIRFFKTRHTFLKSTFFPSTIIEWNKLDHNIRNSRNIILKLGIGIRNSILKFISQYASFFNSYNPKGIKFIIRLWLGLSHLREHKFKHSFQDSLNTFCNCGLDIESTACYLLHCSTCFFLKTYSPEHHHRILIPIS